MFAVKTILVPTDFSENSMLALQQAAQFATKFDAELVLLHVVETLVYPAVTFGAGASSLPVLAEELHQNASTQMDRVLAEKVPEGIRARGLLREGPAAVEVCAVATEEKADLIVIATHGHTGIKHMLLGSTAEKVVRTAPCPVLTVRDPENVIELS